MTPTDRSTPPPALGRAGRIALAACMFVSGAAALVNEVVWLRLFSRVMGHTAYALSAVVACFMGGLAAGAWLGGRRTARRGATLGLYARIELGIALGALLAPWLIQLFSPFFGVAYRLWGERTLLFNVVQGALCGAIVAAPTMLMGATLPVAAEIWLGKRRAIERGAGTLYGLNTLGAALGAALAGLVLLPTLGSMRTRLLAVGLSVSAATTAALATRLRPSDRRGPRRIPSTSSLQNSHASQGSLPSNDQQPSPIASPIGLGGLMALYGLAGFAALALEVAWTRLVGLSIGSTTRAFAVTLTCFIVGLGLGGVAAPHLTFFRRRPVLAIALLHVAIALWSALSLPWLWGLPVRAVQIFGDPGIVGAALLGRELMLVGATILPATICMGAIFPLVAQLARARTGSAGAAVGRVLAANTIGSILGALLGGFLILPLFGMRDAIVVAAGLYLTTAALYGVAAIRLHRIGAPFAVLCKASISLAVIALMMTPSILFAFKVGAWDYSLPTAGPYIHGPALRQAIGGRTTTADRIRAVEENLGRLVDVAEASTGIVGVRELQGAKYLEVGGRNDGALFDRAQSFIAHLPMTLHDRPDRALVIGLGTAGSLQSVLRYPVRRVDCIEVSPEVVLMARAHFFKETRGAMADPRARVSIADARAHLEHTPRQYDVIVSQPSQPWNAGSAGLFTIEAFEAMRERLDGGGVACTWVGVGADPETLPTIVRTWAKVFPQSYLFDADGQGNYALLGLKAPRVFSVTRVRHSMAQAEPAEDLKHLDIIDPADMLGRLALGPSAIARFVDQGPINTDDNGIVEFNERPTGGGPKGVHEAAAAIDRLGVRPQSLIREGEMPEDLLEAFTSRFEAIERGRRIALEAMKEEAEKGRTPQFRVLLGRLQRENPRDPYLIHRLRAIGFPDGK